MAGKYTDDEFLEQKRITNRKIDQKNVLLKDNRVEEFDMEDALSYCFNFVRETSRTWLRFKKQNYERLIRFQNQIFPEKVTFNGEKFGTEHLALVYKINQQSGANKSKVVTLRGIEPRFNP